MKLVALFVLALSAYAQDAKPVASAAPTLVPFVKPAAAAVPGTVFVTIVNQGADPMNLLTGTKVATATLLDATVCNEGEPDVSADNAMVYQRINSRTTQGLTLYDSQVVVRVLAVFQDKNIYAKLFRGGVAASTVGVIITSALKLNPMAAVALAVAPQIYAAILPVVHSPEDIQALAADIIPQNAGGKLAGHSCRAGLVVARTTLSSVHTEVIAVD